jgi:hypothetical protein
MKSAYEIAMSRLEKEQPTVKLTDEQRTRLAEIESEYQAKIAERRLLLEDEIRKAADDPTAVEQLRRQLAGDITRLEAACEERKEELRKRS